MPEKIKQSKKNEATGLEMARQALGRAKEMDLTTEEKERVMSVIKEAKAAENAGNKSKALILYSELLTYLKQIKDPEHMTELEIIQAQRKLLDQTLNDIESDKEYPEQSKERIREVLEELRKIINGKAPEILEVDDIKTAEKDFFSPDEILDLISKRMKIPKLNFVLTKEYTDKDGNIFILKFSRIDSPNKSYVFYLQAYGNLGFVEKVTKIKESKAFDKYSWQQDEWTILEHDRFDDEWYEIDMDKYGQRLTRRFKGKI